MDKNDVVEETTLETPEEETEEVEETTEDNSELEDLRAQLGMIKREKTKLEKALAKKSEETEKPQKLEESSLSLDDVAVLGSLGNDLEAYNAAKEIAKLKNIDITEAVKSGMFKAWKTDHDAELKSQEASLGASKGSGAVKPKKSLNTPGLTTEEHKELFKKAVRGEL